MKNDPGPVPDVIQAMQMRDFATVRAWLEHPYIGSGGAMNALAIFLLEHFERVGGERDRLRAALAAIVGASTREELEPMEAVIRAMPMPLEDRAASIDAIHALLATL
jgi:hypothetical protein